MMCLETGIILIMTDWWRRQ